jgi:isoleucyl-tRNA synthetase
MAVARETVRLGLAARGQAKVKVRQPLHEAVVVASGAERAAIERLSDVIASELNVKGLRFVAEADELGSYEIKPNYRTLGPRFGKSMPQIAAAVAALDAAHVSAAARNGEPVRINVDGGEHALGTDDLLLSMQPLEGYQLEREGSHAVALDLTLDDDLIRERLAREVVHAIQGARKDAGLDVSDRIALGLAGDEVLLAAARAYEEYVAGEVLATSVDYGSANGHEARIEGRPLHISVTRV